MGPTKRVLTAELSGHVGSEATLCGWVHRIRDLGKVCFVLVRDRSGMAQVVLEANPGVTPESVVRATGTVVANPRAPGGVELQAKAFEVVAAAAGDLPVPVNQDPGKLSLEA